ncbi:MAG: hypothetical protein ACLUEQ_05215 [Cloacibacillus evryensis]
MTICVGELIFAWQTSPCAASAQIALTSESSIPYRRHRAHSERRHPA